MNTSVISFLLSNPALLVSTFLIEPLVIGAIVYGVAWWILRPKDMKGTIQSRFHILGILATVLGWSFVRVLAIATFAGRSALVYDSAFSMVAYFLIPPILFGVMYVRWLINTKRPEIVQEKLHSELPPIVLAAAEGDDVRLKSLLAAGLSPDMPGPDGQTALMLAARNGHESTVSLLLSLGASPDAKTRMGATAYDIASRFGHGRIMELLYSRMKN